MRLIYRCLCLVFGAILGSGCSDPLEPEPEYGPVAEYGVPTGTVRIDGRVVDEAGAPIPGVEVAFGYAGADTTDAEGNWSISEDHAFVPCVTTGEVDCVLLATDIDGPDNGGPYPPTAVVLDLERTEPGSGSWDLGTWEQHGVDVTMTEEAVEYGPPKATAQEPEPPTGPNQ